MRERKRILLVDDSNISLDVASQTLTSAGYDVKTSSDPHQLHDALGGWRPDVILTDVAMPGMSGVELCRLLKSSYETADVPVVLFSALPAQELEVLARDCDADGFLSKSSFERLPQELALLIETALF